MRLAPFLAGIVVLAAAPAARAEIAVLANGAQFKVTAHREEGALTWLSLKDGGELALHFGQVRGYVPDEVIEEVEAAPVGSDLHQLAADAARRHGLDPELVLAVVSVESAFRPAAVVAASMRGPASMRRATSAATPFRPQSWFVTFARPITVTTKSASSGAVAMRTIVFSARASPSSRTESSMSFCLMSVA